MWRIALLSGLAVLALAQTRVARTSSEMIRGAAYHQGHLYTWGSGLLAWDPATGTRRRILTAAHGFGEGGCVDASGAILLQEGEPSGPLVSISPKGKRSEWDRRVEMHDCRFITLLGRRGALITDHYGQVRFYEGPAKYTEIYSFYTPSRQAGLLLSDVDGDGLTDIFCGNYWIRSPKEFDLPWRLFAINIRHETPDAATMSLALRDRDLYAAQGHMKPANLLRYRRLDDPEQLWDEKVIASDLRYPHAIAAGAFGVAIAENDGPGSGLFLAPDDGAIRRIGTTAGVHSLFVVGDRLLAVGAREIAWWDVQRRK